MDKNRRDFLKTVTGLSLAAPYVSRFTQPSAAARRFDPGFSSAHDALRALREGTVSSRDLTQLVYQRIHKDNPKVNTFVTLVEDLAMERARQADEARASGKSWGRLHGLPVLIKDAFETAGIRTTCGSRELERNVPKDDAVAVARLKAAGAIVVGKTNLPEYASDLQSYNEVAGTTNNPWNTGRTPGGSTGGGAAALAAGFGFLELGSDIGGSIRTPCHFCGVYGHKPTLNVVPTRGHIPPLPGTVPTDADLNVAGPMARSAQDLMLELEVLGGALPEEALAYRWVLPAPRGSRLKDYRVGFVVDDPFCPVGSDVKQVLAGMIEALRKAGADLVEGWPPNFRPQESWEVYIRLLAAVVGPGLKEEQVRPLRESRNDDPAAPYAKPWLEGMAMNHARWLELTRERLKTRALWKEYFKTHDVFLMPVNFVAAFQHDHNRTFFERTVATPEGKRMYAEMLKWISVATLTGCPATVAPVGRTRENLPVGIQIMGPYLEDATPIDLAGRIGEIVGGFESPPGF